MKKSVAATVFFIAESRQRQLLTSCFASCLFEVKGRGGRLDLTAGRVKNFGSSNPTFCDIELHSAKSGAPA